MRSAATTPNFQRISAALILSAAAAIAGIATLISANENSDSATLAWEILFGILAAAAVFSYAWSAWCIWSGHLLSGMRNAFAYLWSWILCAGLPVLIALGSFFAASSSFTGRDSIVPLVMIFYVPPLLIYFPMLLAIGVSRMRRQVIASTIVGYVEQSIRLNLPLPKLILAAAQGENRMLRKRLLALHDLLDQGMPLDTAMAAAVPEISDATVGAAGSAQRTGRVPASLQKKSSKSSPTSTQDISAFYSIYPIVFLSIAAPVIAMLIVLIMPKFQTIMADFHATMPWPTRLFISGSGYSTSGQYLVLAMLLAVALMLGGQLRKLRPRLNREIGIFGLSRDQLLNWLPVSRGFIRSRAMAELCDLLATLVENGQPMDQALLEAAESQSNALWAARVRQWASNISSGQNTHEAARNAKMPALLVGMIATTSQNTSLAQILQFLGRHYEARFSRLRELLHSAIMPTMVLLMAGIVLLIDLSVFQPLITLDNKVMTITGGF